jgi:hypothetical protein
MALSQKPPPAFPETPTLWIEKRLALPEMSPL